MAPDSEDAEDVLDAALAPGERVLWVHQPDRALWMRALVWGLGCLPFTVFLGVLAAGTLLLGAFAANEVLGKGKLALEAALPASVGALLLGIFTYPMLVAELSRRERRYVITSRRALVLDARRVEHEVDLARVKLVALHKGLFDDTPTGIALRVADGTAAVVFADLADPSSILRAVESAITSARS